MERYFVGTPEEAVERIRRMLRERDWAGLAEHYDLEGSGVDVSALESGAYFMGDPDAPAHPAMACGPVRPFPPAFGYRSHEAVDGGVLVHVGITIDQGDGMVQEGRQSFVLGHGAGGYRVRP